MRQPTFILVHGAWHGAWCWRELGAELDRRGVSWRAMDLPSAHDQGPGTSDLEADVLSVLAAVDGAGPVALVGHSYGGAVISDAASRIDNLAGLVYIAALVPVPGQSATQANRVVQVRTDLDDAMEVDGPFVGLNRQRATSALYAESSVTTQSWATTLLSRQTLASFRSDRRSPDSPAASRYLLCRHDRAIDPVIQELMAERCDQLIELASDHSPFLSHPVQCAEAILATG
jgi:pimeloyl-ACP methyl ester carboxylesterase